jgi:hypothetical protein
MIELKMQGETTLFPLTLDPQFFTGNDEIDQLARRLPLDSGQDAEPGPRRILGSIPADDFDALPLLSLRADLEVVSSRWKSGTLSLGSSRDMVIRVSVIIGGFLAVLWLVRRQRHRPR